MPLGWSDQDRPDPEQARLESKIKYGSDLRIGGGKKSKTLI